MEKKHKIIQVYAVIICIVSVVVFIISLSILVSAIIDRSDPLHANYHDQNLTSFENFKLDALKSVTKDQAFIPDDETLKKMFEAAKEDQVQSVLHRTNRSIIVNSMVIAISLLLFGSHWWWMRKLQPFE